MIDHSQIKIAIRIVISHVHQIRTIAHGEVCRGGKRSAQAKPSFEWLDP
ncbi:MAG: hypothetical protein IH831_00685 [Planctomycetes bacterium]|nr:hypothetical protein [Planctomycetota bacterium]